MRMFVKGEKGQSRQTEKKRSETRVRVQNRHGSVHSETREERETLRRYLSLCDGETE